MGPELIPIPRAPAGCVAGLGLAAPIFAQSTLCSLPDVPPFAPVIRHAQPIVRVSLEAAALPDQEALVRGAELLGRIDPAIVVSQADSGELLLSAVGGVHLGFCVDELRQFFAPVEFTVSAPLVPCKETVVGHAAHVQTSRMSTTLSASCFPLPPDAVAALEARESWALAELRDALRPTIGDAADAVIATKNANVVIASDALQESHSSIIAGFHLCVAAGPLCEEPIFGVAFVLETIGNRQLTVAYMLEDDDDDDFAPAAGAVLQFGELIGSTRDGFRSAFLEAGPRILEPVYRCEIQSDFAVVGRAYDVLKQHRCKIVEERQKDGSTSTFISCFLPVIESFEFPGDLSERTSGKAYPQIGFSHYELVPDDPFWRPQTEEELDVYTRNGKETKPNVAKKIIEYVRRRKGIWVENFEQKADRRATMGKAK
jgi:translation elongation factor EF-G